MMKKVKKCQKWDREDYCHRFSEDQDDFGKCMADEGDDYDQEWNRRLKIFGDWAMEGDVVSPGCYSTNPFHR